LDHVLDGDVAGIFLLGTTGEGPSLSPSLRQEFVQFCCEHVQQRVPILVNISDTSFQATLEFASFCKQVNVNVVVVTAPFYFPLSQDELLQYVQTVVSHVDLPLMLYNMPGMTKVRFEMETIQELLNQPNIVGIKDSSGDLQYFESLCKVIKGQRPDWSILMGPEHLGLQALQLGAHGGVHGGANLEPKLFVQLYRAFREGQHEKVTQCQERILALQEIYKARPSGFAFVAATKCAMHVWNLCGTTVAPPLTEFTSSERNKVISILDKMPAVEYD
jgi:4-hydroxy-tetrahydrodipicolinate synthase